MYACKLKFSTSVFVRRVLKKIVRQQKWPLESAFLNVKVTEKENMASESSKKAGNSSKTGKQKVLSQEHVMVGFNQLRQEQRSLAAKAAELEMELNEHNLVIETLKQVDGDRKCYRMVGGVLVERQAKDVLPVLTTNQEQLGKIIQNLNQQIASKGQEINDYREKHNIRIRGQEEADGKTSESQNKQSQGILVDNKS